MKKAMALFLSALMLLSVLAGCSSAAKTSSSSGTTASAPASASASASASSAAAPAASASASTSAASSAAAGKKVVFLVNGSLGDKGFFDSCAEGINRLKDEEGCDTKIIEMGKDETAYETYFRDVSDQDWDLIVACTWSVQEVFEKVAADYPDKQYLFIDGTPSTPNMMGISFKSNETGFMAGCLAALKLEAGGDDKIDSSKKVLGFVGSMDTTNINDFLVGYIDGVKYIDDSIKIITSYVGSFEDVATCLEMTTQLYNQGAQIVYAPTSQSMVGAVTASSNCDKYLIACDTDIYTGMVNTDANLVRDVLSSSLKKVGDSVVVAANGLWDGSMQLGQNYTLGLAEGTVGLADNSNYQSLVSSDVRSQLDEIAKKVAAGEITIDSAFSMDTTAIESLRNSMKP